MTPKRLFERGLSMRGYLVLLVVSLLVPVLAFTAILFERYRATEISRIEEDLQNDARKLALLVDRELSGQQLILQTLSVSRRIADRDYEGFYREATQIKAFAAVNILLRDLDGQHLVNTRVPWGTPLLRNPVEGDREVIETKRPYISGVITGTVVQRPIYTITSPVIEGGKTVLLLNLSLEARDLLTLLNENLEPGRIGGIVDQKQAFLARTQRFDEFLGKRAPQSFIDQAQGNDGRWRGIDSEGQLVRAAYVRSRLAGWYVWVSVPEAAVQSSLSEILVALAALGAALILLGILTAYLLGGRMARAVQALGRRAAALGRGESVSRQRLPMREVDAAGAALSVAAEQRDAAEEGLRRLSETLERMVSERTQELVAEMKRREASEEQLRQVQKMEAIGQLTGGIAHDFNNMLAIVVGSLDMAQRRLDKGDTGIGKFIASAQEGGRRAAGLTQRLLAFARQQPLSPEPLDANRLVSGMSDLLRRSLGETVQLETVLAGGLWRAHADHNQLESAILNLAVNARDAMPEGGKLTIETGNAYLDDSYVAENPDVPEGQYVLIAVTDIGTGMTRDVADKAFDPFFTTKKSGTGTGLGLSQVYGFVKQSGGHLKIYSEIGAGTTVKVYLPRFVGAVESAGVESEKAPLPTGDGNTTILVVEDETGVRQHAIDALRELGYKVVHADGSAAALRVLEAHPEIDLLFTDVVMPEMNGRQLAEEASRRRPDLKVLFTTGYTRNAIVHNGMLDHGVSLIGKPFTLEQLARKVAEVLGR